MTWLSRKPIVPSLTKEWAAMVTSPLAGDKQPGFHRTMAGKNLRIERPQRDTGMTASQEDHYLAKLEGEWES